MPLPQDNSNQQSISGPTQDADYAAFRLLNPGGVSGGSNMPPLQNGDFQVPKPGNFKPISIKNSSPVGALVGFTWTDIQSPGANVAEYAIFVQLALNANEEPVRVGSSSASPAYVQVVAPKATSAVFYLRPYLTNGQTLPLSACPTCTVALPDPVFQLRESPDTIYIDKSRPTAGGSGTSTTFDISGTFTVPPNVTSVQVECWGAGGTGGTDPINGGGGGGGGAYAKTAALAVTPGFVYNVQVGAGGSGQPTWFNAAVVISAAAGSNGLGVTHGPGGQATNSVGSITNSGSDGADGGGGSSGAGGAAATGGGTGGTGGAIFNGNNGVAPGGGGSGNGGGSLGVGANGRVKITYMATGGSTVGFGVVNDNGRTMSLTDQNLLFINPNGKTAVVLGDIDTSNGSSGQVTVSDGVGTTNDVTLLSGSAATATGGAATLPGNPVGFINIKVGGTSYKIPFYAA